MMFFRNTFLTCSIYIIMLYTMHKYWCLPSKQSPILLFHSIRKDARLACIHIVLWSFVRFLRTQFKSPTYVHMRWNRESWVLEKEIVKWSRKTSLELFTCMCSWAPEVTWNRLFLQTLQHCTVSKKYSLISDVLARCVILLSNLKRLLERKERSKTE